MLISPCYFDLWMGVSCKKYKILMLTLKAFFIGPYESPQMAASISWPLLIFR